MGGSMVDAIGGAIGGAMSRPKQLFNNCASGACAITFYSEFSISPLLNVFFNWSKTAGNIGVLTFHDVKNVKF